MICSCDGVLLSLHPATPTVFTVIAPNHTSAPLFTVHSHQTSQNECNHTNRQPTIQLWVDRIYSTVKLLMLYIAYTAYVCYVQIKTSYLLTQITRS